MDDLVDELRGKVGKKKSEKSSSGSGSIHSTLSPPSQQSKEGKRRPWHGNCKPAFNDKGEPLCFNCQEYGYMAKDYKKPKRGSSDSGNNHLMAAPLSPGLKDLKNQLGSLYVKVGQTRLQEMETLVEICTKQESVDETRDWWQEGAITTDVAKTTANVRKTAIGIARKDEIGVMRTNDPPTTTEARNSTMIIYKAEFDEEAIVTVFTTDAVIAIVMVNAYRISITSAINVIMQNTSNARKIHCGTTMLVTYSTQYHPEHLKRELFDTGSDCNITNDENDFIDGTYCDLSTRKFPIMTGAGPVYVTMVSTTRTILRGLSGEPVVLYKKITFFIPGFLIKIFSGDRFY
jgi:hypothetical protein